MHTLPLLRAIPLSALFLSTPTLAHPSRNILDIARAANVIQKRQTWGTLDGSHQPMKNLTEDEEDEPTTIVGELALSYLQDEDGSAGAGQDAYVVYMGDGTVEAGWPDIGGWVSWTNMWEANQFIMASSCSRVYQVAENSPEEIEALKRGIEKVSDETRLDHRFVLAVILQESGGCVRVPTSSYEIRNPGLMQSHNGNATCNEVSPLSPCDERMIEDMIREGVAGTNDGDGLVQCINDQESNHVRGFYRGARCYNSGAVAENGNLEEGGATACYASDVANRLTGWVQAESGCWF